jgi:hypothetical protein
LKKITQINIVLNEYFEHNKNVQKVPVAFMMSYFVLAGIFKNDESKGKSIQNFLRRLEEKNQLHLIPFAKVEQKNITKKWFFTRASYKPILLEQNTPRKIKKKISYKESDTFYVLGLCNKILISKFEPFRQEIEIVNPNSQEKEKIKIDGIYPSLKIAIKYVEKSKKNLFLKTKTHCVIKATLKQEEYQIIFLSYKNFKHLTLGQLERNVKLDLENIRGILDPFYPKTTLF